MNFKTNKHAISIDACVPFGPIDQPGFALPISLTTKAGTALTFAIDEITGRVAEFQEISGVSERLPVHHSRVISTGDELIYAFLSDDNFAHLGTQSEIEEALRAYADRHQDDVATLLQIAELVGSKREKHQARLKMRSAIFNQLGPRAALAFYEGSALRSALWSRLLAAASSSDSARRILASRSSVGAQILPDGSVNLEISAINPADYSKTTAAALAAELGEEFEYVIEDRPRRFGWWSRSRHENELQESVQRFLRNVRSIGRQEERAAVVLEAVLSDRAVGITALDRYSGRAKFENAVLDHAKTLFRDRKPKEQHDITIVQSVIENALRASFPIDRSKMFLLFSKHLGKYPQLNRAIREQLKRTSSYYVRRASDQITEALDKAASG